MIHACEYARDVLPVIETQIIAGMRPFIVTPQGAGSAELYLKGDQQESPRQLSLLREWQDVRNWRKSILDCNPEFAADVLHAHSFAAGMAAVRNCSCVVYDVQAFIEELAIATGQCDAGSWMGRSFRVAEQFILARAGAIVVHSARTAEAARERGAPADSIFVIPDPLPLPQESILASLPSMSPRLVHTETATTFFVPSLYASADRKPGEESLAALKAFMGAAEYLSSCNVALVGAGDVQETEIGEIQELARTGQVRFVDSVEHAWELADVVIVPPARSASLVDLRRPNAICVEAMMRGKAVIAADTPENRDVTPYGRGCLWYAAGNTGDLAARIVFMAENPGFRSALAQSGLAHLRESRGPAELGRLYEEAYRHAASRRRPGGQGINAAPQFLPIPQAG